jgi:hypothetical protein
MQTVNWIQREADLEENLPYVCWPLGNFLTNIITNRLDLETSPEDVVEFFNLFYRSSAMKILLKYE